VPAAIQKMVSEEKHLQVRVIEGRYSELLRDLREGEIDCLIGALRNPPPADDIVQEKLFMDSLALIVGPNHPLVGEPAISLEDALSFPWIASPIATPAGQFIFQTLKIEDRPQTPIRVVTSSLVVIRGLMQRDNFVTVISEQQIKEDLRDGTLVKLPIPLENNKRAIGLTTRRNWQPTDAQNRFLETLKNSAVLATK
jgi:DNA-binding transcriptional LysR family regulator